MASDSPRGTRPANAELTREQLDAVLAELDDICRQARELTASLKADMAERKLHDRQVLGPQRFSGPIHSK
jgi:hypothetical protein